MRKDEKGYHHGDLRNALIAEAIKQIDQEGTAHLTLRDLARRLGVSHTAPYRHFPDKQSLLKEVAEDGFRQFAQKLRVIGNNLEELMLAYVEFARANPMRFALMFGPEFATCWDEESEASRTFDLVLGILHCQAPTLSEAEARLRAIAYWAMAHGLAVLILNGQLEKELEQRSVEDLTKRLARFLASAFAASSESSRS